MEQNSTVGIEKKAESQQDFNTNSNSEELKNSERTFNFKTSLGKRVLAGEFKNIDEILDKGIKIREAEIVDYLIPDLKIDFLNVGQMKGKMGGGKRTIRRNTQQVTAEGKKQHFALMAVVGDGKGHIGIGYGRGPDAVIAREKAIKRAKTSIIKIKLGCGSRECACDTPHSIPFNVEGKNSSVRVKLICAPKGLGLCASADVKKIMRLAGIKDIWVFSRGNTSTRVSLGYAVFDALKKINAFHS
ncbi:MAG: 30S ribosomal protein S5 [Candidatus Parvarchaeota archaeon]|nr:30S ribosomal protein S5 [Candidatus Rehaiarchaeum fermentans]MCW1293379.1 30S ribosomal protein S5 [Candidatus Rehaiarchaeum fermentans]